MKKTDSPNDKSVEFLCCTKFGRILLHITLFLQIPKLLGLFLRSPFSHFMISRFIKKNHIDMSEFGGQKYISFNDFFTRKKDVAFDEDLNSFISPCDSLLSVYKINDDSTFHIKGFDYTLQDFFNITKDTDEKKILDIYKDGLCLVFRLCATDYHRYCYIDNGHQTENNYIKGSLYSVQPAACENFRVYTKNRRSWTLLQTQNFGTVAQIEIGAFSVGGIKNHFSNHDFTKGQEKGYFDLHGSTIVLLVEKDKLSLIPEIAAADGEYRVNYGSKIGMKKI